MTPFTDATPPENPRAVKGGNKPRISDALTDAVNDLPERLDEEFAHIKKRTAELTASLARAPKIVTADNAGAVSDAIAQISAHVNASDALREAARQPVLTAQRQINGWFDRNCFDALDVPKSTTAAKQVLTQRLTVYERAKAAEELRQRQEAERLARDEAMRAAQAAEAASRTITTDEDLNAAIAAEDHAQALRATALEALEATTAPIATLSTVRGDFGSSSSLRANWKARPVDKQGKPVAAWDGVNLNDLRGYISADAVEKAANAHARAHHDKKPVVGIEFWNDATAAVRG